MKIEIQINQEQIRLASVRLWVDSEAHGIPLSEIVDGIRECLDNSDMAKRIDSEIIKKMKDSKCIKK